MKSRIIFENTEYTVNTEEKKVTCSSTCIINLKSFDFWKLMNKIDVSEFTDNTYGTVFACRQLNNVLTKYGEEDGLIVFEVTGVAKCNENDVFSERTGKSIANTRAQEKAFKEAAVIYHDIMTACLFMFTDLNEVIWGCQANAFDAYAHCASLEGREMPTSDDVDEYVENNFKRIYG